MLEHNSARVSPMGTPDNQNDSSTVGRRVSFGEAFRFWVKLGFISFGGRQDRSRSCIANWWSGGAG